MRKKPTEYIRSYRCFFVLVILFNANISMATPEIIIDFKKDDVTEEEWVHAQVNYGATEPALYKTFDAIGRYDELHSWILDAEIYSVNSDGVREYTVEFEFPWPVGKQWSCMEVTRIGESTISWRQLGGTLGDNHGRIVIVEQQGKSYIDYRAIIDVGYPDTFTRVYKKQFVVEFLEAIYDEIGVSKKLKDEPLVSSNQDAGITFFLEN